MTQTDIQDGARGALGDVAVLRLSELLTPARVRVPLESLDKDGTLAELVGLVVSSQGLEAERDEIYRAVCERERVLSTGIGEGVAVPHAKYDGLDGLIVAAGVSREPIDFGALDGRAVQLFFLILGPEAAAGGQVRVLSRVGRLMRNESLRGRLFSASNAERFLEILQEAERAI
jgi:mannitol/fructose-specific phosphotransferase system IIA component (Ntr-type)